MASINVTSRPKQPYVSVSCPYTTCRSSIEYLPPSAAELAALPSHETSFTVTCCTCSKQFEPPGATKLVRDARKSGGKGPRREAGAQAEHLHGEHPERQRSDARARGGKVLPRNHAHRREELKHESYGVELLHAVGFVYSAKSKHYLASTGFLGSFGGVFHSAASSIHVVRETVSTVRAALELKSVFEELAKAREQGITVERKRELEEQAAEKGMRALFKGAKLEVESVIREVSEAVLYDASIGDRWCAPSVDRRWAHPERRCGTSPLRSACTFDLAVRALALDRAGNGLLHGRIVRTPVAAEPVAERAQRWRASAHKTAYTDSPV
ncbi:hypothetical protein L1887_53798 [Cichorium endivia]|nr:hypothetical protein L1887_53798 [Cichorium endivia]